MNRRLRPSAALALLVSVSAGPAPAPFDASASAAHGFATVDLVRQRMLMPDHGGLYAQEVRPGDHDVLMTGADCWSAGVQLSALTAAAKLAPDKFGKDVRDYVDTLNAKYWSDANGIGGYDDGPHPKPPDRYYDDNAWVALGLVEAYEVTHAKPDLDRAGATLKFVLGGEDGQLGGGLFWRERKRDSKNTCSQGPGLCAAVRVYQYTHDQAQLAAAVRLYRWTVAHLRDDRDGLYYDNVRLDGQRADFKWSYNTALMIRGGCLLGDATGDASYLRDAQRSAAAAVAHWVDPDTGGVHDPARFAHLLLESLLEVSARDHDGHWAAVARRSVDAVWARERDAAGFFPERWDRPQPRLVSDVLLINQASAARAFLRAAWPK